MLIDVIAIYPGELLKNVFFVLSAHLLLVVALLHAPIYLALNLLFHIIGHVSMILKLAHAVHIVLFLIKFKGVKTMLFLLLIVNISCCLLFLDLLFGFFKFIINGSEHVSFLLSLFLLFFFRINQEQLVRDVKELPEMGVLGLQLLNHELIIIQLLLSDMTVILNQRYLQFIYLCLIELDIYFLLLIKL